MTLLLDTHAFLWFILDDPRLSAVARALMADPTNELLLSPATYWEIAIKVSLGKYTIPGDFAAFMDEQIRENRLTILPIAVSDVAVVASMPFHHRDPFDRMLIAQTKVENLTLVTYDAQVRRYELAWIW